MPKEPIGQTQAAGDVEDASETVRMSFHHVGVAVKSIEDALRYYTGVFGFRQASEPVDVPPERVRVCMIEADPGVRIELVEGLGEDSPVKAILDRIGGGTYHICYSVDDLDAALRQLRARGFHPFKRFELPGQDHRRFAFVLTPDRQLFELCESERRGG
jgi:methylmalonyl-CoA/ethylmalonyl-CoA epimerase